MFVGELFYVPLQNIANVWKRHHYRQRSMMALIVFEQGGIIIVPELP